MEHADVLFDNLNAIHERYNRLQGLFNEFCTLILSTSTEDDRLNILTIEQSGNTLNIGFLDRKIEANFLCFVDDDGGQKGHIYCKLLYPTDDKEPKLIEKFSFNGQGLTNISSKDNSDSYNINERIDAITILFNWASISVKENF